MSETQTDRVIVNRENGQKSTGPRTEEGKQRSRFNAFRHGLTSQTIVLPWEDRAKYQALCKGMMEDLQPKGAYEKQLAQTIIDASWKLNRGEAAEANMFAQYIHVREGIITTGDEEIDTALISGGLSGGIASLIECCLSEEA